MNKNRNNTRINYLYRDACNYKLFAREIIEGRITPEQIDRIKKSLIDGEYFDPAQVGLRVLRFSDHGCADDPEIDGPLHEWLMETEEYTSKAPSINMTVEELVKRFEQAHASAWDGLDGI